MWQEPSIGTSVLSTSWLCHLPAVPCQLCAYTLGGLSLLMDSGGNSTLQRIVEKVKRKVCGVSLLVWADINTLSLSSSLSGTS